MDAVTEMAMTLSLSLASPMWALKTQDSSMVRVGQMMALRGSISLRVSQSDF